MATFRALDPLAGLDPNGLPFRATTGLAIQGLPYDLLLLNEFPGTSLAQLLAARLGPGGLVDDERGSDAASFPGGPPPMVPTLGVWGSLHRGVPLPGQG